MSYEKQTWQTGDVVTADKLNHMEDGIAEGGTGGGDVFVVPVAVTLDISGVATFSTAVGVDDVLTALSSGKYVVYVFSMDNGGMTMMLTSYQLAYAASYHIVQINAIDQGDTIGKMTVYHTTDGISETPPAPPG